MILHHVLTLPRRVEEQCWSPRSSFQGGSTELAGGPRPASFGLENTRICSVAGRGWSMGLQGTLMCGLRPGFASSRPCSPTLLSGVWWGKGAHTFLCQGWQAYGTRASDGCFLSLKVLEGSPSLLQGLQNSDASPPAGAYSAAPRRDPEQEAHVLSLDFMLCFAGRLCPMDCPTTEEASGVRGPQGHFQGARGPRCRPICAVLVWGPMTRPACSSAHRRWRSAGMTPLLVLRVSGCGSPTGQARPGQVRASCEAQTG